MLSQGLTTKKGYQRWYSHKVPFDFAKGGVVVEWVAKVKQSTIHSIPAEGKLWAGWGVHFRLQSRFNPRKIMDEESRAAGWAHIA